MNSILVLENGATFRGRAAGPSGERIGEVVLNTAVVGYQEMLTDATNAGKILILTYPLIGNYGVNKKFNESEKGRCAGLVIKEMSAIHSNWMSEGSLGEFLRDNDIPTIAGVDTRTAAVNIRDHGEMFGAISDKDPDAGSLLGKIREFKKRRKRNFIEDISVNTVTRIGDPQARHRVVVYDLGMSQSFINELLRLGCELTLVPYNTPAKEVLNLKPKGVIVSNGPEDDAAFPDIVEAVRGLLGRLPLLGFSTGHQVLCRAMGAGIERMKVGHHGVNYPLKRAGTLKGEISVQNHSWVVNAKSASRLKDARVWETNLNDNTIESVVSKRLKALSVQYYPSSPGFDEVSPVFKQFTEMLKG